MTVKRTFLCFLICVVLMVSGCGTQVDQAASTPTALEATSTFSAPSIATASETPLPPPPQPTAAPVAGTSSTQINVRAEPSTSGNVLGMIPPNTTVQIVGKDPGGNWWQILYEGGIEGRGWVSSQYVTTTDPDAVPVIGANPADPENGNVAIVQQQINVRSGPGTGFNSLGTLNAQDVVSLTGKDSNGAWLQIAFSAGPEGKGWVNAAFVRAQGVENLPIVTEAGQIIGTGTPTAIPAAPTPTVIPAWMDNDSASSPLVNVIFEPGGTHTIIYNGEISTPQGDAEDWINFQPHTRTVFASLNCTGNGTLQADLLEAGVSAGVVLACDDLNRPIDVNAGSSYSIHLYTQSSAAALQYIRYTIKIQSAP